ncbi:hypothetical protein HBH98_000020 [Parastagonospora nodorum]|nr:hypothetical protein HBH98_000020 [Parastagonospora nodorum]
MNYAYSFQDPIASYDKENQGFMPGVSQRCDSDQLFQKACRGGLKLENTLDSGIWIVITESVAHNLRPASTSQDFIRALQICYV